MNGRGDVAPSCQDSERCQFFRPTDDDPPLLEEVNRYLSLGTIPLYHPSKFDIAPAHASGRFTKSRNVGAYLGLTPRRYQSGEVDRSGRISVLSGSRSPS